ncbi:Hypothetical predicted protein [Mytilus galloprovincialis]|uniref:CCHC-type domain-containing protein n=1 Tax=Mytilus galloprovincialis TaxID=29158 RepID=A0A8B6E9A7_MYTGA|nr:Hypothetical predicted protein [Mytilus galloprovincialis]
MLRIYMDNEEDRLSLLIQGLNLRGKQIPLHQNPRHPSNLQLNTIRIKVKNVPYSGDDEHIHRALTLAGCNIQDLSIERLRVDGHIMQLCTNDWVCKSCNESGHKMMECTKGFSENDNVQENEVNDEHTQSKVPTTQVPIHSDVSDITVKMKNTSKSEKDEQ